MTSPSGGSPLYLLYQWQPRQERRRTLRPLSCDVCGSHRPHALKGWTLEVVERTPGTRGFTVQPRRWVVARRSAWLIRNWRLAQDYERRVQTSETFIEVAAARLAIRRLAEAATTGGQRHG